ncbi:MAG: hypothetical protein WBB01_05160 [Phormidesmis sp.]
MPSILSNTLVYRWLGSHLRQRLNRLREHRLFSQPVYLSLCTLMIALLVSALLGTGLARATTSPYGMVDPVDSQQIAGYQIYIEQCATCHVALPAAVLPTQTWQTLVTDPAHYGVSLAPISRFNQQLMLRYLQTYSRFSQGDRVPYRLQGSPYFQALHPKVDLPQPLNLSSCTGCHLGAAEQDYTEALDLPNTSAFDTPWHSINTQF